MIRELAVCVAVCVVSPAEFDRDGLHLSNLRAQRDAVSTLEPAPDVCFIDAYAIPEGRYATNALKDGDNTSAAVTAASIIATTTRDDLMVELAEEYPGYGFEGHTGYINDVHNDAIRRHGVTPHHRRSSEQRSTASSACVSRA